MKNEKQTTKPEEIKLPAHLQAIVDKLNGKIETVFTVTDVTPAGYGPDN